LSAAPQFQPSFSTYNTANGVYCNYCGATPAVATDVRGHRGFIFYMQFVKSPGPFCRDCGLATYRRLTIESLWIGWWGMLSSVINPVTMLINLGARSRIVALPPPIPGGPRRPMDPGKPLYQRPAFLGWFALWFVLVAALWILVLTGG